MQANKLESCYQCIYLEFISSTYPDSCQRGLQWDECHGKKGKRERFDKQWKNLQDCLNCISRNNCFLLLEFKEYIRTNGCDQYKKERLDKQ